MDNQNVNTEENAPMNDSPKSLGSIIGAIIIVIIIILGGFYFWGNKLNEENPENTSEVATTSDEVIDIEADLDTINTDELDVELDNIDAELGL